MKNLIRLSSVLFVALFVLGCNKSNKIEFDGNVDTHSSCSHTCNHNHNVKTQKITNEVVSVKAIGIVDMTDIDDAVNIIESFYGYRCVVEYGVSLTSDMFYNGSSDVLNGEYLVEKLFSQNKTVYLIDKKLYGKGTYLRGIAAVNGNVVVVRGEKSFLRETLIHELGHTLGLRHCSDLTCIMAVDNDQYDSGTFCNKCSRQIGFNNR